MFNSESSTVHHELSRPAHFKIYREYVEHEDTLINQRILWNVNIQGFLFATYGFTVQKLGEIQTRGADPINRTSFGMLAIHCLIFVVPFVGATISILTAKGIQAAQCAIEQLCKDWEEIESNYKRKSEAASKSSLRLVLPAIKGGGAPFAHEWGLLAPRVFPWVFTAAWGLILTVDFLIAFRLLRS